MKAGARKQAKKPIGDEAPTVEEIFARCYRRFRELAGSQVALEDRFRVATFVADFLTVARKELTDEDHRVFRWHFLLDACKDDCCQRLEISGGEFDVRVSRIRTRIGRAAAASSLLHEQRGGGEAAMGFQETVKAE